MGVFEEMRSLLQGAPSARRWSRLCAYAAQAESAQFVDELLPYALHHLDRRWPDGLRVADRSWLAAVLEDAPTPWLAMARKIQAGLLYDERSWQWSFDEERTLDAFIEPLGEERWTKLIEGGFMARATELFMNEQGLGTAGARALVASDLIGQLHSLRVHDDEEVVREILLGLSRSATPQALDELGLSGLDLDEESSRELDAFAERSGLTSLQLRGSGASFDGADLRWPALTRQLESLDLYESYMSEVLPDICALPFERLRSLNVGDSSGDKDLLEALVEAPWVDGLEHLELSWMSDWHEEEYERLLIDRGLPALRTLDLMSDAIGEDALMAILRGDALPSLTHLELGIADSVTGSFFDAYGAPLRPELEFLGLGTCTLHESLIGLIEGGRWSSLRHLDIPNNDPEGEEIRFILGAAEDLPRLERIGLGENRLADDDLVAAAMALALPSLVHLDLRNNNLTDDGAVRLASCDTLGRLEVLDVRYNRLTQIGVDALLGSDVLAECAILS